MAKLVNIEAACRAYRAIPGVRYAEPETLLGDGSDIEMVKDQGTWYVIVRKAWGTARPDAFTSSFISLPWQMARSTGPRPLRQSKSPILQRSWRPGDGTEWHGPPT